MCWWSPVAPPASPTPEEVLTRVSHKLEGLKSLTMTVSFSRGEGAADPGGRQPVSIRVAMAADGRFSARASDAIRELGGIVCDGAEIREWDCATRKWTRYPVADRPPGWAGPRLLAAGPLSVPMARFTRSWITKPTPYEWILQRLMIADNASVTTETADGQVCIVVAGAKTTKDGPVGLTEEFRCVFRADSYLPVSETTTARVAPPFEGSSTYQYVYRQVGQDTTIDNASFEYRPPDGWTFVEPPPPPNAPHPLAGTSMDGWSVNGLNGETVELAPSRQEQAGLILVWATWCVPCKSELDAIAELQSRGELDGVRLVAVSVDRDGKRLREFLARHKCPMIVGHDPGFLERARAAGVPVTIVLDRDGAVRDAWTGWVGGDDGRRRLLSAVRDARRPK